MTDALERKIQQLSTAVSNLERTARAGTGFSKAADVAAGEATSSTSYADLTTPGPAVTVEMRSTAALVIVSAFITPSGGATGLMSFAVSGKTVRAALDVDAARAVATALSTRVTMLTGLTPGQNIFTSKYKASIAASCTFADRRIVVIPL
jgi:hypothetical protein